MTSRISVRLDEDVQRELAAMAAQRGIGLATLLRELAEKAAREALRARIYAESQRVGAYVRSSPEAREFFEFWGTPKFDI